LIIHISYSQS